MKFLILILLICFFQNCFAQQEKLVWSDEFNGTGAPDPANWGYDLGSSGWGNAEIQNYTNSTQNARQENGSLIIEAIKQGYNWTSARLLTNNKHEFKYGRVVFRAKLPVGSGTWPALWLLGENFSTAGWPACGEIDVMEHVGKDPGWVHSAIHTPSSHGSTVNRGSKFINTFNTEFHTYELNWTYEKLEFRIDSVLFYTYRPAVRNLSTWPFDKPLFIIMNIAMGGNWGSDPQYETGGLKNGIDPSLAFARMVIDYVRVYQFPISVEEPSGAGNNHDLDQSFLSPNPTDGKLQIDTPFVTNAKGIVYNLCGKNVFQFIANNPTTEIDLSTLAKGLYCITLQSEGKTRTNKLIIR
ncbi:MAG: family 16 glycosylhydrolase [Bacteroidota bacterium]